MYTSFFAHIFFRTQKAKYIDQSFVFHGAKTSLTKFLDSYKFFFLISSQLTHFLAALIIRKGHSLTFVGNENSLMHFKVPSG